MRSGLRDFALRFQEYDEDRDAETVIESFAHNSRQEFDEELERLLADLSASDTERRRKAARTLYELSDAVPGTLVKHGTELVSVLDHDEIRPFVSGTLTNTVFEGLRDETFLGERKALVKDLEHDILKYVSHSPDAVSDSTRVNAVASIRYLSWIAKRWKRLIPEVESTLVQSLSSDDEVVREMATKTFAVSWAYELGGTEAVPALLDLTTDPNPRTRANSINALGNIVFETRDEQDDVRNAVEEIVDVTGNRLDDEDRRVRYDAVMLFVETVHRRESTGRVRWPWYVGQEAEQAVVNSLVDCLSDQHGPIRRQAATALRQYSQSESRALSENLDQLVEYGWSGDDTSHLRVRKCVTTLASNEPGAVVEKSQFFVDRVSESDDSVAAAIIGKIATEDLEAVREVVPSLVDQLGSHGSRHEAARALANIYRDDPAVVPEYIESIVDELEDPDRQTDANSKWEPLAVIAKHHPETAADLCSRATEKLGKSEDPNKLRFLYAVGKVDLDVLEPTVELLVDYVRNGNPELTSAAVSSLQNVSLVDQADELLKPAEEPVERRLEGLDSKARDDAKLLLRNFDDE